MKKLSSKAFTLIELLVVLTIIAILIIVLVPGYGLLQGRVRLQNTVDMVVQSIEQARTLATSGYLSNTNGEQSEAVGVYLEAGTNTITLFSGSAQNIEEQEQAFSTFSNIIHSYNTADIYIQHLQEISEIPNVVILFFPPFGNSHIIVNEVPDQHLMGVDIEIGLGMEETPVKKKLRFGSLTNRLSYEE